MWVEVDGDGRVPVTILTGFLGLQDRRSITGNIEDNMLLVFLLDGKIENVLLVTKKLTKK